MAGMPEAVTRRCPKCGRKAHDSLLVLCPDCRVPFAFEAPVAMELTPEQLRRVASQIFGSWKFWAFLIIIVGAAAWGVVVVADKVINYRAKQYMSVLESQATNHIDAAFGQISNQIAREFKQPKIKAAIEQVARERANDLFTNGVRPSLEAFQDALDLAAVQLGRTSNTIAQLQADASVARRRIPQPVPDTASNAVVQVSPTAIPSAAAVAAAAPITSNGIKLVLINQTLTQAGTSYLLTLFFKTSNPARGSVEITAGTYKQTARILNFAAMTTSALEPPVMNDTGDAARTRFSVSDKEAPTVIIEVSAPTIVRFISDAFDQDLTIPVAPEKMQVPQASK